jgi:hypothetical protein
MHRNSQLTDSDNFQSMFWFQPIIKLWTDVDEQGCSNFTVFKRQLITLLEIRAKLFKSQQHRQYWEKISFI